MPERRTQPDESSGEASYPRGTEVSPAAPSGRPRQRVGSGPDYAIATGELSMAVERFDVCGPMSATLRNRASGRRASLRRWGRGAARALAGMCALVLLGLGLSTDAHAAGPCPDGARCATVTVPLDRSNPSAGTIDIAYALLPHTDRTRPSLGTVLPNPGGPGSP